MNTSPSTSRLRWLLPWLGTLALATWLATATDLRAAFVAAQSLPPTVALGVALLALSEEALIGPFKWRRVVHTLGAPITFGQALLARLGSQPIRALVPLKAGELASALYLKRRHHLDFTRATSTLLFEKAINLWATCLLLLLGLTLTVPSPIPALAVLIWLTIPFLRRPWRHLAARLTRRGRLLALAGRLMAAFLTLPARELLIQLPLALLFTGLEVFSTWWILTALGAAVTPGIALLVVPLSYFLNNIPVTVLGIGMREGLFVVALAGTATEATLLAAGVLVTTFEHIIPTLTGLLLLPRFIRATAKEATP